MKEFTILISDRNRNVREYLKREFTAEGYRVIIARSAQEILEWIYNNESIDLVILDPELPYSDDKSLLERINDRVPSLPVVVHSFSPDYDDQSEMFDTVNFVEKNGSSIEHLKKEVFRLTEKDSV